MSDAEDVDDGEDVDVEQEEDHDDDDENGDAEEEQEEAIPDLPLNETHLRGKPYFLSAVFTSVCLACASTVVPCQAMASHGVAHERHKHIAARARTHTRSA
jgi:hypothetical protein